LPTMTDNTSRPILFLIDVEPDARKTSGKSGWESSEAAFDKLEALRGRLANATGRPVNYNWFFRCDPQIDTTFGRADYVEHACPRIVRKARESDDAAGVHIHLWRWSESSNRWYNDLGNREWLEQCVATSIDAFNKIFGAPPLMSRYGDRWLSHEAIDVIREAGIRYELTLEPGMPGEAIHDDPHATGSLPDLRRAPRVPYRPARSNYLQPSDTGDFWMIPLSTTAPQWRLVRRAPWLMRASRSPNLALATHHVWPNLQAQLDKPSATPLVIVFRSGDLSNSRFLSNFERTTDLLVRHPALAWCEFSTIETAMAREHKGEGM
jgi:hypothetical protein